MQCIKRATVNKKYDKGKPENMLTITD